MALFPDHLHDDAGQYAQAYFKQLAQAAESVDPQAVAAAGRLLVETALAGGLIYACGNGGSAAIANHLVCDCMKGVRGNSSLAPRVVSLSSNIEIITAIANDIGMDQIFSYQLQSLGKPGDVLIAISSSGASPNILAALQEARNRGVATITMTGFSGGDARKLADVNLHVDAQNYGVVEDTHQSLMHILAQYMRHAHLDQPTKLGTLTF